MIKGTRRQARLIEPGASRTSDRRSKTNEGSERISSPSAARPIEAAATLRQRLRR
jgi:hypothetical protein